MKTLAKIDCMYLETLVDRTSLASVLRALRDICDEKAAHITENWQDNALAAAWSRAAVQVGNTAERSAVVGVSQE